MTQPRKVLIIDDDKWLAETYGVVLTAHHWEIRVCHDAHKAIDVIDEWLPDAILLDYLLPHASAVGLLHELQSHDDTRLVPVVLCTSLEIDTQLQHYGVYAALDKAIITPEMLVRTLEEAVRHANT